MRRLLLATNNGGKIAEYRTLLQNCGWEVVTPGELAVTLSTVESGGSYAENAALKVADAVRASGLLSLADDSGLEIAALGGEPGLLSARFLGEDASYEERFREILGRLADLPPEERKARFVCVIALAAPGGGKIHLAEGEVRGLIADKPRGERGFGYDPIFWVPEYSATMAELSEAVKNRISHRARAVGKAREILRGLLDE